MGVCDNPSVNCDVCFEVLIGDCLATITLSLGLTPSTLFFFRLIDKSGREYDFTATTDGSGNFAIDKTQLPDDLINQFAGDFELQIFSDSGRTVLVSIIQNGTLYNCTLLVQQLSGSNDITPPSDFDTDAQAYFNAVAVAGGSLSSIEKSAWNNYVIDSKNNANAWFTDTLADYPMLGGTASSCKINAKNPGTFDLDFVNTIAGDFASTGWTPNGIDSYARTGLIPSVELTIQSVTLEYYSRDEAEETGVAIGSTIAAAQTLTCTIDRAALGTFFDCYSTVSGAGRLTIAQATSLGGYTFARRALNDIEIYRNGVSIGSDNAGGGSQPNIELTVGAQNTTTVPVNFTTRETAGALVADGLTSAQVLAQYNAREMLNASLSRNV